MLRLATPEQVAARKKRVAELYKGSTEDSIVAVLMDTERGGHGLSEGAARRKAREIIALLKSTSALPGQT